MSNADAVAILRLYSADDLKESTIPTQSEIDIVLNAYCAYEDLSIWQRGWRYVNDTKSDVRDDLVSMENMRALKTFIKKHKLFENNNVSQRMLCSRLRRIQQYMEDGCCPEDGGGCDPRVKRPCCVAITKSGRRCKKRGQYQLPFERTVDNGVSQWVFNAVGYGTVSRTYDNKLEARDYQLPNTYCHIHLKQYMDQYGTAMKSIQTTLHQGTQFIRDTLTRATEPTLAMISGLGIQSLISTAMGSVGITGLLASWSVYYIVHWDMLLGLFFDDVKAESRGIGVPYCLRSVGTVKDLNSILSGVMLESAQVYGSNKGQAYTENMTSLTEFVGNTFSTISEATVDVPIPDSASVTAVGNVASLASWNMVAKFGPLLGNLLVKCAMMLGARLPTMLTSSIVDIFSTFGHHRDGSDLLSYVDTLTTLLQRFRDTLLRTMSCQSHDTFRNNIFLYLHSYTPDLEGILDRTADLLTGVP